MRKLIILAGAALGLLFASCTKEEQRTLSVIPAPLKVELQQGVFPLNPETGLYIDASEGDKKILKDYLAASFMKLKPVAAEEGHTIVLKQVAQLPEVNSSEGYVLTVTPDQVLIRATSGAGLFYGVQTMLQMADERIAGRSHYRRAPFCLSWLYDGCFPSFFQQGIYKKADGCFGIL